MPSIGDYRKIMDGLDGWNEAAGFVRPEDVERWNADDQITLKTFPILLNMSIKAPTVRSQRGQRVRSGRVNAHAAARVGSTR